MNSNRKPSPWILVAATIVGLGIAAGLWFTANRGTAERSDGIPAVARVLRADDGSCIVGAKRHHCYRLSFEVLPEGEPPFLSHLDVNVPDRWASRIQPGSLVWVVRDRESPRDVSLALEAFAEPPPTPR
jgi:hypothetical protein